MIMDHSKPAHKSRSAAHHVRCRRLIIILAGGVLIVVLMVWSLMLPANRQSVPGSVSAQDKKEVARLCRWHTVRFSLEKLRHGEVGWFIKSWRVLFQQKINRFSENGDGTYKVYTVVIDPKEPDGFYVWWRHQVARENGRWVILRSY